MWKRELELINSLGKLYPNFNTYFGQIEYSKYNQNNIDKAAWLYFLCVHYLHRRLIRLEKFIEHHTHSERVFFYSWEHYIDYFKITNKQCGKEN